MRPINKISKARVCLAIGIAALATAGFAAQAQNILQPSDPIIASSSNSPGSEGVANAIDGKPTKYLNFDSRTPEPIKPSGFVVSPKVGATRVTGMTIQSANDAVERDPKVVTLEGSNDATITSFAAGNWQPIATINAGPFATRFETQTYSFANNKPYKHYRWTVVETFTANGCCMQVAEVELLGSVVPADVTKPSDAIIASSSNSPGSEGVKNAIDGQPTKYLNFDSRTPEPIKPSGFVVTPEIGRTLVTGMSIQSANDAVERDPKVVTLEGSNDATVTTFAGGNWVQIAKLEGLAFATRFETQTFLFDNFTPYKHYRWTVVETFTANGCCMQVAEVELLGTGAPKDVTQPGDQIYASSSNSPGSEGVKNAIDGQPTKYLNFDSRTPEPIKPSGFAVTPSIGATTVTGMTIQSANDAVERDPKQVLLEGSNDDTITSYASGTWEKIVQIENAAFSARFETQEFFFPNTKSYKHYRWIVLNTATPNGCCMQVAEVELLAVTGVDCDVAKFTLQPVNTPVLSGSTATFFTAVNGPWPLRWLKNGQPVVGANAASLTTEPITAANASDVYEVEIIGCEKSSPVKAVIFTPSTTKSIGVSFIGSGANGAPTRVNADDIIGVQPQAYWNNAATGTGEFPGVDIDGNPVPLLDSSNAESTISFSWATSGSWGAGTGNQSGTQRMLNGLVLDSPGGDPATITFGNVPAGKHAVLVYAVSPPLQFQVASYTVTGKGAKTYYARVLTPDEYNAAPGYYRSTSTDRDAPTIANFMRFDDVEAAADGTIVLAVNCLTTGFDRGTGVNGIQLVLNAVNPGNPPAIVADPQPTLVEANGTTILAVNATGAETFQWLKDGRNLPNGGHVSGATTANLRLSSVAPADEGVYSVAVFNSAGSVISKNAAVRISPFDIKTGLAVHLKLNETGGTLADNAVATGSDGTVKGTANWAAGIIANAFAFDGLTHIFVPNYTKAKAAISGSVWVNLPSPIQSDVAIARNAQGPLTVSGGTTRIVGQFEIGLTYDSAADRLLPVAAVGIGPNVARATSNSPLLAGSGWHHIAFTADGAQLRLYFDGVEVARVDYLAEINPPDVPYISIGARLNLDASDPPVLVPDEAAPNFLAGSVDDFALWTRGLAANTIKAIYDAGKAAKDVQTVVEPKPAALGPAVVPVPANGGLGDVGTLVNVTTDTAAKIIRADLPADLSKPAFLKITPGVTILSVKIEGNQLVIGYQ